MTAENISASELKVHNEGSATDIAERPPSLPITAREA